MAEQKNAVRGRDDKDLHDAPDAPGQGGRSGGGVATDVGTRDEEAQALGGDPEPTRVTKQDKVQPDTGTRADNEGAGG